MRKYPKYKASGVDWLGEIPSDWTIKKYKYGSSTLNGFAFASDKFSDTEGMPLIRIRDLTNDKIETFFTGEYPKSAIIKSGDLLVGMDGDFLLKEWSGPDALLNQRVCKLLPRRNFTSSYLKYIGQYPLNTINELTYFVTVKHLSDNDIKNTTFPIPSIPEQHAIVRFLDYKTGQIDSFIANRQKQIELLKEQKAGIINKAVTKGINPNAKMKDSGIEWIGEVPEYWMIGKIRRVLNILTDFTANGSFADLAKNVKYLDTPDHSRLIRLTDLREDLKNEGIYVNKEAHKFLSKSELFGGEILMANVGAYAGLVCLVPKLDFIATLGPNMFLLKFDEKRMSNQFAFTLLGSDCYYKLLMNKALSSAQPKLNKEDVKSIDFIFPPTQEEQKAILDWIKEETSNVDTLISKYQKQIDLMQEYRTSLISQAVTGKIDVREWQPKKQHTA